MYLLSVLVIRMTSGLVRSPQTESTLFFLKGRLEPDSQYVYFFSSELKCSSNQLYNIKIIIIISEKNNHDGRE